MVSVSVTFSDGFKGGIFSIINGIVGIIKFINGTFNPHFFHLKSLYKPYFAEKRISRNLEGINRS